MKAKSPKADARPPRVPPERSETVRQEVVEVLARFGPMTVRELSAEVRASEKELFDHLGHIRISLRKTCRSLVITPAECRRCGFVFENRTRLTKPGKCPECRSTSIEEPEFSIR